MKFQMLLGVAVVLLFSGCERSEKVKTQGDIAVEFERDVKEAQNARYEYEYAIQYTTTAR